jgi:hypothetical protein
MKLISKHQKQSTRLKSGIWSADGGEYTMLLIVLYLSGAGGGSRDQP